MMALWIVLGIVVVLILFAISAGRISWGEQLLPTSAPLPTLGYPFLVLTFGGWIWTLLRPGSSAQVTSVSSSAAR